MSRGGWEDDRDPEVESKATGGRGAAGGESATAPLPAERHDARGPQPGGNTGPDAARDRDVPIVWRDRVVPLSASARETLRTVGTFRAVAVADLARTRYGGDQARLDRDLRSLQRRGWLVRHTAPAPRGGRAEAVVTLTRDGHDLAQRQLAPEGQRLHWGLVKPKEQAHDAALFRVAEAEAARLARGGGTVTRVILDAELKGQVAARRNAPGASPDPEAIARTLHLRVVNGTVQIPDVRLEYETREGTVARVDLELATEHYKPSQVAAKVQAGFTVYAPASQTGRLSAALEDRGVIGEIFSL